MDRTDFSPPRPQPEPKLLLCFLGYAGSSARQVFGSWEAELAEHADVLIHELPGRGSRSAEPRIEEPADAVREVCEAIRARGHSRVAIVGHSLGGMLAYETALAWEYLYGRDLEFVIVSGARPPKKGDDARLATDDASLLRSLREWDATPSEVFESEELLDWILPVLRSDLILGSRCAAGLVPLAGRLVTVTGESDPECPPEDLTAWRDAAQHEFETHTAPGGHLYLNEQGGRRFLMDRITREIALSRRRNDDRARDSGASAAGRVGASKTERG